MGLGNLVADAAGVGGYSGSSLKGFISKFSNPEGKYVDTIDPLHTFDVSMAFFPKLDEEPSSKGFLEKATGAAVGAAKNALNSMTGGLVGALLNDSDIMDLKDSFTQDSNFGETTFVDYIARGNLMVTDDMSLGGASEKSMSPQLILDISYYVQGIQLPNFTTQDGGTVDTMLGTYPTNGSFMKPSQNTFQINVMNTKAPLAERVFYPWMREVTLPYWSYNNQPYTTANISISFQKHADLKYLFVGCRPTSIEALQPTNDFGVPTRQVTFAFDHVFVNSELKSSEDVESKLVGLGVDALNDLGSQFGL